MKRKKITEGAQEFFESAAKQGTGLLKSRDISKMRLAVRPAATFILSLFLGMVRAPMGIYPFSYAVIGASQGGVDTVFAFLGSAASAVAMKTPGIWQSLILIGMVAARFFICFLKGDLKEKNGAFRRLFRERGYIRVIISAAGAAAFGCISIINSQSIYYGIFSALLGIGSSAIICAAFIFFVDSTAEKSKKIAGLAFLALGLSASLDLFGLPFSLGAVLTFFAAVYFSSASGGAVGALVGFAGGMAVGTEYAAALGAVGIICSLLWEYSRMLAVILAAACASVLALFGGGLDALTDIIPELALSAAICAPLVNLGNISIRLPAFLDFGISSPFEAEAGNLSKRYDLISEALSSLSQLIREVSGRMRLPTKQEAYRICNSIRAKNCSGCIHEKECSGVDKDTVDSMFYNMGFRLVQNGCISAKIVPETVARRCFNMDTIIDSINSSVRKAASLSGGAKKAEIFASDYSAVASLLSEISEDDSSKRDTEMENALTRVLSAEGFSFVSSSVFGKRARKVYMYGVAPSASAGEKDVRLCVEKVLGGRMTSPEFSIDSGKINAVMYSLPVIKLSQGRYSVKSKRDYASGDSLCSFENSEGYYYTIVSDGMGSGREAAIASGISATFLEKLLSAGCPMRSTLELLNCFVRGAGGETFTTVDLMEADLYTGRARFIKSGAAPSFIIRKGQLYRLHSKTVPVGIMRALDAESLSFDLRAGDTVIMMSDGVTGSYEESPWLYELLTEEITADESPKGIARRIATAAAENTGRDDDITVCVLKVEAA